MAKETCEYMFRTSWNLGIKEFTLLNETVMLKSALQLINELLPTQESIYYKYYTTTINIYKIKLESIILNNPTDAIEQLNTIGDDLSTVVKSLCSIEMIK